MKKFFVAVFASLALVSGLAFAVPSVQQIESAMSQGDWQRADSGLTEVLQAHPDNARAHYLYAQVLNREGRYADALTQVQQAKQLDPQVRFTQPQRFAQVEAKIRSDAARAGSVTTNRASNPFAQQSQSVAPAAAMASAAPVRHGPGIGMWIGIAIVVIGIALVLRWTLRRAKSNDDAKAGDDRRDQLKRATDLLNGVRSLKLDVKLSTAAGHEVLEKDLEAFETQLRGVVERLSGSTNPVAPYEIEDLERQFESLKARAEGRPDPNAHAAAPAAAYGSGSAYAREADAAFGHNPQYPPQYPPQQQPQVIVQQGGGGMGGMGGLLTGVLLGEALNHGRDRVIERDVIVDDDGRRVPRDGGNGGGLDFGQGSNDWDDGSGGGVDMGSNDSSSDDWNS
ncbi:tetratricopeptide repeat protein [Paraburkholderia tropica]|uniref:Tetratricopeptide repeat-containing protein n=1 Tax=Paraburkholderia tropica TaxID=92647 RepID=A0AAQ1JV88_9BURK|nr:tetratricopeptide repeat protein [Paraburkholderia tropica]RQN35173.1 tetratricopeptide repeat protein [Paraburkholderia tropica]SEJ91824.1 Tetratricopeptide repeat-containing protein [Paraburkholderia tropica]